MKCDEKMRDEIFKHYLHESYAALQEHGKVDLIVWPETMFRYTLITQTPDYAKPSQYADWPTDAFRRRLKEVALDGRECMAEMAKRLDAALLVGVDRQHFGPDDVHYFNSAAYVSRNGELLGYYDKMRRVMFGEYVPLADRFPWLQKLTPLSVSISPGQRPAMFVLGKLRIAPNICYENVLSHEVRAQINELRTRGEEPNAIVNLTNDGWFWGSSELDMHLASGVFRAVECHKPMLIAANTGFSAWIDGDGRRGSSRSAARRRLAVGRSPRGPAEQLVSGPRRLARGACLAGCLVLAAAGSRKNATTISSPRRRNGKEFEVFSVQFSVFGWAAQTSPPLPPGEGPGVTAFSDEYRRTRVVSGRTGPHPNPLPAGEGTEKHGVLHQSPNP